MSKSKTEKEPAAKKSAKSDDKPSQKDDRKSTDGGWRETVESIAMAVILALLFRGFVAEAFVIPTGSMAPTLQGRHKDVWCPKCGIEYQTSASEERSQTGANTGAHVTTTTCPVCQYTQRLDLFNRPNDHSFSGDRIIVGKFCYDLAEPERWDVIVFKFPGDAVQNYIKRLVGLPNETIRIVGGNIYAKGKDAATFLICRKPPHKLNVLLQLVDDTDHIPQELIDLGWPLRWQELPAAAAGDRAWRSEDGGRSFVTDGSAGRDAWLRYRHLVPSHDDWTLIEQEQQLPADLPERKGQLIPDFYAYNAFHAVGDTSDPPSSYLTPEVNDFNIYDPSFPGPGEAPSPERLGQHWVDDLAVECLAEVTSDQGELLLMLVRGGLQYRCRINLADGQATLSVVDEENEPLQFISDDGSQTAANPAAATSVKGPGQYRLRLSNCDHEVLLWVNGSVVQFDGPTTYAAEAAELSIPFYSAEDPGDLAPAGVGSGEAAVRLSQLRIYRDKYYIATTYENSDYIASPGILRIHQAFRDPALWETLRLFGPDDRRAVEFELGPDQFLPLGDNSPQSSDARFWYGRPDEPRFEGRHHFVERDLLIGKALLIYWPHTWWRPIPYMPNFRKMGPIR